MDNRDKLIIKYLNPGLPIKKNPFLSLVRKTGIGESRLLERIRALKEAGVIQRLGAIVHHARSGYSVNAMVVWKVPQGSAGSKGKIMAGFQAVSHCYQRKTRKNWPYNLYTMIHSKSRSEIKKIISAISRKTGINDYEALYTVKEFKKAPLEL